jgi:hypothetical protein
MKEIHFISGGAVAGTRTGRGWLEKFGGAHGFVIRNVIFL